MLNLGKAGAKRTSATLESYGGNSFGTKWELCLIVLSRQVDAMLGATVAAANCDRSRPERLSLRLLGAIWRVQCATAAAAGTPPTCAFMGKIFPSVDAAFAAGATFARVIGNTRGHSTCSE